MLTLYNCFTNVDWFMKYKYMSTCVIKLARFHNNLTLKQRKIHYFTFHN